MKPEQLAEALYRYAGEAAARNAISSLNRPAGRRPDPSLVRRSQWFLKLQPSDQELVAEVAHDAARCAIFGVLCILDGVRMIEDGPDRGALELYYVNGPDKVLLNDIRTTLLHEIAVPGSE